jgi:hypothetical protein
MPFDIVGDPICPPVLNFHRVWLLVGDNELSEVPEWEESWWNMGQESPVACAAETRSKGIKNTINKNNTANDLFLILIARAPKV